MRILYPLSCLLLFCLPLRAQQAISPPITQVMVFPEGAQILRQGDISLPAGKSQWVIRNLPPALQLQGVQAGPDAFLRSVAPRKSYQQLPDSEAQQHLKAQQYAIGQQRQQQLAKQKAIGTQLEMLRKNRRLGGTQAAVSPQQLQALLDYQRERLGTVLKDSLQTVYALDSLAALEKQLSLQARLIGRGEGNSSTDLYLEIETQKSHKTALKLRYLVKQAGWTPSYSLRMERIDAPLQLAQQANIWQHSGEDWNQVQLSVLTSSPSEDLTPPKLEQWAIGPEAEDIADAPLQGKAPGVFYETVVVSEDSKTSKRNRIDPDKEMTLSQAISKAQPTALLYQITTPYSIPSDKVPVQVPLRQLPLNATYTYYTIPKKSEAVYLQARIADWQQHQLQAGEMSVFIEGEYTGKQKLVLPAVSDTLKLLLGADRQIAVKRVPLKQYEGRQLLGTQTTESYLYEIQVKNHKEVDIPLQVLDQLPLSEDKAIKVEDTRYTGMTLDPKTHELKWIGTLKAFQQLRLQIGYTLRYPSSYLIYVN